MSLLDKINPRDKDSRRRWSIAIAVILITRGSMELLQTIAAGGEQTFINNSGPVLHGHQFHRDDLKRIFRLIEERARLNRKFSEQELHALLT